LRSLSPGFREMSNMEDTMNRLFKKFEDIMVAITFAEAGEYDEAKRILNQAEDEKLEEMPEEVRETA
jgi:hypothetical protein